MKNIIFIGLAASLFANPAIAQDFGQLVDQLRAAQSSSLYGVDAPLTQSVAKTDGAYRTMEQSADDQIALAPGLKATYLTREAGDKLDMYALYPAQNPTHLIACIEGGREEIAANKFNPSVQSIALEGGAVKTLLRGMDRCDGIRTTAWGTILATEETDDGAAYELLRPLELDNQTIIDRTTGENTAPSHVAKRAALPIMAWEGLEVLASGVVIAGDELRPGTALPDANGGSIFKFIPSTPHTGGEINALESSPLVSGNTYAMQVSCNGDKLQFGQGCEIGNAAWIQVDATKARQDADNVNATGYYRPEDLHIDPVFQGEGVRFCWANTGNEGSKNYGEIICGIDAAPLDITTPDADNKIAFTTVVNRFVEGDDHFTSVDNLAFQPHTGILYAIEDHKNGDIWACLPDGQDRDIKSDGCIKVISVKDSSAEPSGFMFSHDGMTAYLSIQHSNDENMPKVDDYGTDDFIVITGFKNTKM